MVRFSSNLLVLGATQLAFYALVSASPVGSGNVEPTKVQGRQEATKIIQNQSKRNPIKLYTKPKRDHAKHFT